MFSPPTKPWWLRGVLNTLSCKPSCMYKYSHIFYVVVNQKKTRTPCLSFAEAMLGNNASYEDSFITCQITPDYHRSLLDSFVNMQLASRNPFSGQVVADYRSLFWKAYWATPFKMHFDFRQLLRKTFTELSRKYPYPQTPAIRGHSTRKGKHQVPWCLALAKPHFWKLDCYVWRLFLETSKHWAVPAAGARMCFRTMVFGCGEASPLEARLLPMKGKVNVQKHHTAN